MVENGHLVHCEPFVHDPAPSPMLGAMPGMVYSPTRIQRPAVRSERGDAGIFGGSYGWSLAGRFHHARTQVRRFLFAGGGCTDRVGNCSWGAAQFILPHVIGTYEPVSGRVTDWTSVAANTRLILAFGGLALKNGQIASGGAGEHSMGKWLHTARERGIEFVVISPTRADAPAFLDAHWIPIRPNTDTALMLAMAHTLLAANRHDAGFLERHCTGFDAFRRYLTGEADGVAKTAAWAAAICGIDAETIRQLAFRSADTRSLITLAWSLQRAQHGEQPYWMAIALAAMIGQIGLPGGGFAFGHGSMNGVGNPRADLPGPEFSAGRNPAARAIPVARLTDMLEKPGGEFEFNGKRDTYRDIGLIYWAGGNPFHHHQDLNRLSKAWEKPDTVVVDDNWWTPTARRADIVLPATTTLERNDIGGSSRDRYVFAMQQAIAPVAGSRDDFDIFSELAGRGGLAAAYTAGRNTDQWLREIWRQLRYGCKKQDLTLPAFEEFWRKGWVALPPPARECKMDQGVVAQANKVAGREKLRMNPDDAAARGICQWRSGSRS